MKPTPSQWEAIRATDRHLLVAAGAGTGKTSTVVGRILYLLGAEVGGETNPSPIDLQGIAAITYTNAAAADLKRKLREGLREAGLRDVAYQVDGARIGTIHGFCGDILRESALRSGLNPGVEVLEEGESGSLTAEAVRDALIGALEDGNIPGLDRLLTERRQQDVEEWVIGLVGEGSRLDRIADSDRLGDLERPLVTLAQHASALLTERLEEQGAVDFDRMITWTRDLLRDDPSSCAALQRRLHTLIVDEFQDVDPVQKEIAWLLGNPDARSAGTTRLMLVGDPKQSIYRFRRADVTVWRGVERAFLEEGLGGVVTLEDNFRSVAPILAFVDAVVGPELDRPIEGEVLQDFEVPYHSVAAAVDSVGVDRAVELFVVPAGADGKALKSDLRRAAEAEAVARRAAELHKEGVRFGEMAALFAGMGAVQVYQDALERKGIRTYLLRGEGFFERREVLDLLVALQAVREPRDDRALTGFLRSPFVGLKDETLLQIAWQGKPPRWELLTEVHTGEDELLARGVALLREHAALRDRIPTHELLERLLDRSGYLAHLTFQGPDADQAVANVRKFLRLARQHAGSGLGDFLRLVQDIRDRGDRVGDERLHGANDDVMTLTTIHSAKGLEWDTVFWCDIERRPSAGWGGDACIVGRDTLALKDPDAKKDEPQPEEWTALKRVEDAESAAERKRLWYVAATRAKRRLILAGLSEVPKEKRSPGQVLLGGLKLTATDGQEIRYAGQGGELFTAIVRCAEPKLPAEEKGHPDWWSTPLPGSMPAQPGSVSAPGGPSRFSATSLLAHQRCPRRYWLRYVVGLKEPWVERGSQGFLSAIVRGQIVHDVLEQLDEDASVDDLLEPAIGRWDDGAPPPETESGHAMRQQLREEIGLIAGHPDYQAIAVHPTAQRELGFLQVVAPGVHVEGKIDLAAREESGLVLLDVKTAQGNAEEVAGVASHYDMQRAVYVGAAEGIGGEPVARFAFQFSRAETQISTPITDALRAAGRQDVSKALAAIASGEAALTAHPKECEYCGFKAAGWCPGVNQEAD